MIDKTVDRHPLGFYQIRNIPSQRELEEFYAQRYYQEESSVYSATYSDEEIRFFRAKTEQFARLAAQLRGTDAPGSLLDVGCGEGFAMQWFADDGWRVTGIDFSAAGIAAINPAMEPHGLFGDIFVLLDEQIRSGKRYDVVWLKHVLEHVTDPLGLLETLRQLTAPDGLLVVTVPNDFSALQEAMLARGHITDRFWVAPPDHLSYFDNESLARAAEHCGWVVRDMLSDFPIDLYLLHPGSNYRSDPAAGKGAHQARLLVENLIAEAGADKANDLYRALAATGLGRSITALLAPRSE